MFNIFKKNIKNKKINLFVGLYQKDMKTKNTKIKTLKIISREFIKNKISGFNCSNIDGFYNYKQEPALLISFVNNYNVNKKTLDLIIKNLNKKLDQQEILLIIENCSFEFL